MVIRAFAGPRDGAPFVDIATGSPNRLALRDRASSELRSAARICSGFFPAFRSCTAAAASARLSPHPGSFTRHSARSEEHTSELQSHLNLVCRLLLEKKKNWLLNSA